MPSAKKQLAEAQEKLARLEGQLEAVRSQSKDTEGQLNEKIQNLTAGLQTEKGLRANVEQSLKSSHEEVEQLSKARKDLTAEVSGLKENIAALEAIKQDYESLQVKCKEQLELIDEKNNQETSLTESIKELKSSLETTKSGTTDLQGEIDALKVALQESQDKSAGLQSQLDKAEEEKQDLQYKCDEIEQTLSDRQTLCADLQAQLEEKEKMMEKMTGRHGKKVLSTMQQKSSERPTTVDEKSMDEGVVNTSTGRGSSRAVQELKNALHEKSVQCVQQGEKVMELSSQLYASEAIAKDIKLQLDAARKCLLKGIAGDRVDVSSFSNVPIPELVRIRLQGITQEESISTTLRGAPSAPRPKSASTTTSEPSVKGGENTGDSSSSTGSAGTGTVESLTKMEKDMQKLRGTNKKLQNRAEQLEGELKLAVAAMDDVRALKDKTAELAAKQRTEKELRQRSEEATRVANEKIALLTEHIEKLMTHLKHEAAAKSKAHNTQKQTEKEISLLRDRNTALVRKNAGRERIINELKEGSKILEDQLRLMDEKYIELRSKLDWTRSQSQREVKKIQSEANALRAKWALAVDQGAVSPNLGMGMQQSKSTGALSKKGKSRARGNQHDESSRTGSPSHAGLRPSSTSSDLNGTPALPAVDGLDSSLPWSDAKISSLHDNAKQKRRQKEAL